MIKQFFSKKKSPAPRSTITDGMLVLSFPDARDGAIWRLPLATAEASSFQLTNDKGEIRLTMTGDGGKKEVLAIYYEPERARRALDSVMDAIMYGGGGSGSGGSSPSSGASGKNRSKLGWFKKTLFYSFVAIIGVIVAYAAFILLTDTSPMPVAEQTAEIDDGGGSQAGVPQSVDELFGN